MNDFGLKESAIKILFSIFAKYIKIEEVILYGSRAKGNFNERSDLDLVITKSKINTKIIGKIISEINENNFPYTIDIQLFDRISNQNLIEHINRVGKVLYKKN